MSAVIDQDDEEGLAGKCVLVVEDDYVLAREVCNDLTRHGASVLGPAPTVHYANLIMGKRRIDGAILDIRLYGEEVYELVDALTARGVPIVFATAYQPDQVDARYRSFDVMTKPLDYDSLRRKVANFRPLPIAQDIRLVPRSAPAYPLQAVPGSGVEENDRWARLLLGAMRNPN